MRARTSPAPSPARAPRRNRHRPARLLVRHLHPSGRLHRDGHLHLCHHRWRRLGHRDVDRLRERRAPAGTLSLSLTAPPRTRARGHPSSPSAPATRTARYRGDHDRLMEQRRNGKLRDRCDWDVPGLALTAQAGRQRDLHRLIRHSWQPHVRRRAGFGDDHQAVEFLGTSADAGRHRPPRKAFFLWGGRRAEAVCRARGERSTAVAARPRSRRCRRHQFGSARAGLTLLDSHVTVIPYDIDDT
jgi:hypothetical protein